MTSKAYYDSNGQLAVPLVPPVQGSEGFTEYSSSSASFPNDVSYDNLSAYIAKLSHLNPNFFPGNMGSPILNISTDSGPRVGASSLITNATHGADFLSSTNIESYQNLPSSPLSVSSSNMSALAIEDASPTQLTASHLNQINQVVHRRERPQHDTSSLYPGKELELLDYLPQMSKKPRLDIHAENVLHQYIIQQLLQKQEPLVFQNYNQQLKTLLQQNNLQKLKQKQVLQSVPQYAAVSTQQQMMHYLQQLAKCSAPAVRPLPSGFCSRRLMQFIYHLQHRPSDNSIAYWRKFVAEYYAPHAKKRWCLSLYNAVGERALGVFSQLAMEAWHCDLCSSNSGKGFEANFELLPRLYKAYFESGVLDELLFLDLPHEYILPSGLISLRYEKAVQETIYEKFRVVREGQLRIIFRYDLKILAWDFCARCHDEVVPRSLVAPQVNELVQAAEKYQSKGGSSRVAVQDLQSTCKKFVVAEGQLMRNLDTVLVNDLGFPKRYIRYLQIADIMNSMKDLMTFSLDNNVGPIESLARYSREGSEGNTQKKLARIPAASEAILSGSKQAVHGGMSCHEKMQCSTSNSEKPKSSGFMNYSKPNTDCTPLMDPKSSRRSFIQRSPVSVSSSSMFSEFDDKLQEQMIDKLLQQMESNTRDKANLSKNAKVKVEVDENLAGGSTADEVTRSRGIVRVGNEHDVGNTSTAVWKSVPKNGPEATDTSKSASSYIRVKQEPDVEDIYKDLYLPEAIRDVDRGFFRIGALNDEWDDIGWKGKN